jgi:hypothetical protein
MSLHCRGFVAFFGKRPLLVRRNVESRVIASPNKRNSPAARISSTPTASGARWITMVAITNPLRHECLRVHPYDEPGRGFEGMQKY